MINNKRDELKWLTITTDFEISLYNFFNNVFKNIKKTKHVGCFFHFMKNIRKYLMQHNYTKKENAEKNKYIINNIYKFPFKKDINKSVVKEITKICKKGSFYKGLKFIFYSMCSIF